MNLVWASGTIVLNVVEAVIAIDEVELEGRKASWMVDELDCNI